MHLLPRPLIFFKQEKSFSFSFFYCRPFCSSVPAGEEPKMRPAPHAASPASAQTLPETSSRQGGQQPCPRLQLHHSQGSVGAYHSWLPLPLTLSWTVKSVQGLQSGAGSPGSSSHSSAKAEVCPTLNSPDLAIPFQRETAFCFVLFSANIT